MENDKKTEPTEEQSEIENSSAGDSDPDAEKNSKLSRFRQWIRNNKGPSFAIAALSALLALSIGIGYSSYCSLNSELDKQKNELSSYKSTATSLQSEKSLWKDKYSEIQKERDSLKEEIGNYQDQQATIDDEKAKLEDLHSQLDSLQADRDSLQEQVDTKKLADEHATQEQEKRRVDQESKSVTTGQTVYWVSGGSVYHTTSNCPTLKRSSNIHSGSIAASGKSRCCKVCG